LILQGAVLRYMKLFFFQFFHQLGAVVQAINEDVMFVCYANLAAQIPYRIVII
jgi:hypothetical protein